MYDYHNIYCSVFISAS